MKCPFRIKKTVENLFSDNPFHSSYGKVCTTTESTEFEECLENDCPYYGVKPKTGVKENGDLLTLTLPICRKVENNG